MLTYKAPLRDIKFLLNDVFDYPSHFKTLRNGDNADPETVDMILQGLADFTETVLSPLYQPADEEGCHFKEGEVTTPEGFKEHMINLLKVAGKGCLILKNTVV